MPASKYQPELCPRLIAHMTKGESFESFGATVNVGRATLYDWLARYPEWAEAKAIAELKCLAHWEGILYAIATGQVKTPSAAIVIFKMKSKFRQFGYRDYGGHEGDDADDSGESDITKLPTEKLLHLIRK